MKRFSVVVFLLLFQFTAQAQTSAYVDTVTVGEWNVENLFDTVDDPGKKDEEFTPDSPKHWNKIRLTEKIEKLSRTLSLIKPDIWGFEEVEHKALIDSIVNRLNYAEYSVAYAESPDFRGIDNALMFRADKFKLAGFDTIKVHLPNNRTTRYILYVRLKDNYNNSWNIFVNHWPSRWGGKEKSEPKRISAAQSLKKYLICNNITENVIIMGDFNDDPTDPSIKYCLSAKYDSESVISPDDLLNLSAKSFLNGSGSLNYRGKWNMLDQIIVSQNLVDGGNIVYVPDSFHVIKFDFLVVQNGKYKGNPYRTYAGKKYLGGYSDHFPVAAKFLIKK